MTPQQIADMPLKELERLAYDYFIEEVEMSEEEAEKQIALMSTDDMEQLLMGCCEDYDDDNN